jgi:hypothetical protein
MELRRNEIDRGKTEELGEKPVPVPLCPPQIPHGLTRDRTRASAADRLSHGTASLQYLQPEEVIFRNGSHNPEMLVVPVVSVYAHGISRAVYKFGTYRCT